MKLGITLVGVLFIIVVILIFIQGAAIFEPAESCKKVYVREESTLIGTRNIIETHKNSSNWDKVMWKCTDGFWYTYHKEVKE